MDDDQKAHVGPPDLILQAIVPPTDAPAEIRAAVADALARRRADSGPVHTWEDISFAASAIALVEGTNQRAEPDTQWVFAVSADDARLGERVSSDGAWSAVVGAEAYSEGTGRPLWSAVLLDRLKTSPRP